MLVLICACAGCERQPTAPPHSQPAIVASQLAATIPDRVAKPIVAPDEVDQSCPRLLSTAPNVTEICCALGLADCLVGRTRFCTYPPAAANVTSIGDLYSLNAEVLLQLNPDLILVSGASRGITSKLDRLDLRYETLPDVTIADLLTSIKLVGQLTNRPQTAELLADQTNQDLARVAATYAGEPARRVLVVTAPLSNPPTHISAAGPGSFYDDLLCRAGHTNVAAASARPFAELSFEFILKANPEVIIELVPNSDQRPTVDRDARAAWARVGPLQAVSTDRVHVLRGPQHFILGPRIAQTFDALCRTIAAPAHDD